MQYIKETLAYIDAINLALNGTCIFDPNNFDMSLSQVLPRLQALERLDAVALNDEAKIKDNSERLRIALNSEPRSRYYDMRDDFLKNSQKHIDEIKTMSKIFCDKAIKTELWERKQQLEYIGTWKQLEQYVEGRITEYQQTWSGGISRTGNIMSLTPAQYPASLPASYDWNLTDEQKASMVRYTILNNKKLPSQKHYNFLVEYGVVDADMSLAYFQDSIIRANFTEMYRWAGDNGAKAKLRAYVHRMGTKYFGPLYKQEAANSMGIEKEGLAKFKIANDFSRNLTDIL